MTSKDANGEQDALIESLVERLRKRLKSGLSDRPITIDEIERRAQEISDDLARSIEKELIDEQDGGKLGPCVPCGCGGLARYKGMRSRRIVARGGVHEFARAYYYCARCRSGQYPLDSRLGLGGSECTGQVRALAARFCSYLPYRIAAFEIESICGVHLSVSTLERHCIAIGQRIKAEWDEKEQLLWAKKMPALSHRPKQLHVSMDGAIIFVDGEWREAKLGVVYERSDKDVERARYYATMQNSVSFGRKMRTLAQQAGSDRCAKLGVIADGGVWIWQEAAKHFPNSTQILDYYHVTEHLWEAARLRFGEGSHGAAEWMSVQEEALLDDRAHDVIAAVKAWGPGKLAHRDVRRKLLGYLETHIRRMPYKTLKQRGWHIGSGVMEAGCKAVVKARMGGAGMRWGQKGADAMLHMCAHWRSHGGGDFQPYAN